LPVDRHEGEISQVDVGRDERRGRMMRLRRHVTRWIG
jgi:hypothetical protein